ncbi:hypothetical protein ACFE04_026904 [Oxalis oulophora]
MNNQTTTTSHQTTTTSSAYFSSNIINTYVPEIHSTVFQLLTVVSSNNSLGYIDWFPLCFAELGWWRSLRRSLSMKWLVTPFSKARQSSIIKDIRGKQQKLVEKDPEAAIGLFWKAINAEDRVHSALKDMTIVLKQEDRVEEAIEAIQSFRDRCSKQAKESLDNVLMDLYKDVADVEHFVLASSLHLRETYLR